MTRRANLPCECGSGKPFKKCCRGRVSGTQELFRKIQAGEIPFSAQIVSETEEPSSMQVGDVVVVNNGVSKTLSNETLTLTTNTISGDKTQKSVAQISLPVDGSEGKASTVGNASISNNSPPKSLRLYDGKKKLKAKSPSGGFVVAKIGLQRNTQIEYFDLFFGTKGQSELVDENGIKNRPHIALHPDGNGKFLRLASNACEFSTEQTYSSSAKEIVPSRIMITSSHFEEVLVAKFVAQGETVELISVEFETKNA
jgi:hypothetical protein